MKRKLESTFQIIYRCFEFLCLFVQWCLWLSAYFWLLFFEIPHLVSIYGLNLCISVLTAMLMVCFCRSLWLAFWESSGAFVSRGKTPEVKTLAKNTDATPKKICNKCGALRASREIHHCSTCQRCVYKMDHHCICLATCVSAYNYPYFISYVFLGWLTSILFTCSTICFLYFYIYPNMLILEGVIPFTLCVTSIGGIFGLGGLGYFHLKLLSNETLTIDYWFFVKPEVRDMYQISLKKAARNLCNYTNASVIESLFWPVSSPRLKSYQI